MLLENARPPLRITIEVQEPHESHARRDALEGERAAARRVLHGPGRGAGVDHVLMTAMDRMIDRAARELGRGE